MASTTGTTIPRSCSACSRPCARPTSGLWAATPPDARERFGVHRERGPESYDLMWHLTAGHDRFHVAQAERALAAVRGG